MSNRKVICAGCLNHYLTTSTVLYRKKRCCGAESCYKVIDEKVAHFNYKKQQKKLANGTFRHGVPIPLKTEIIKRDENICRLCINICQDGVAQVHHIIPVSHGGIDTPTNLILLCSSCHTYVHQNDWRAFQYDFENYTNHIERRNPTIVHSNL